MVLPNVFINSLVMPGEMHSRKCNVRTSVFVHPVNTNVPPKTVWNIMNCYFLVALRSDYTHIETLDA